MYLTPLMVGKTGSRVQVVVISYPAVCYIHVPLMAGKTGSRVPVILTYLHVFDTPHGREDWVACPSGSNKFPAVCHPSWWERLGRVSQ